MGGLLFIPWIFAQHAAVEVGSAQGSALSDVEKPIYRWIMNPAMGFAWIFGLWIVVDNPDLFRQGWFHGKLTLVVCMTVLHLVIGHWYRRFARQANVRSAGFYRVLALVLWVIMVCIVIMAIVKPF